MMKADPRFIISIYPAVKMRNPKFENIHDGESKLQLECILTFYTILTRVFTFYLQYHDLGYKIQVF